MVRATLLLRVQRVGKRGQWMTAFWRGCLCAYTTGVLLCVEITLLTSGETTHTLSCGTAIFIEAFPSRAQQDFTLCCTDDLSPSFTGHLSHSHHRRVVVLKIAEHASPLGAKTADPQAPTDSLSLMVTTISVRQATHEIRSVDQLLVRTPLSQRSPFFPILLAMNTITCHHGNMFTLNVGLGNGGRSLYSASAPWKRLAQEFQ